MEKCKNKRTWQGKIYRVISTEGYKEMENRSRSKERVTYREKDIRKWTREVEAKKK
jgi:hypothetical protein